MTLRLETRDATAIQAKISIGLSLQAAELVGKGLLLLLGVGHRNIRAAHSHHNVLELLRDVEQRIITHADKRIQIHDDFLTWMLEIEGDEFGSTIGRYLEDHFSQGSPALPRSYFYPDIDRFIGPNPIQALYLMVEHLIEYACGLQSIIDNRNASFLSNK